MEYSYLQKLLSRDPKSSDGLVADFSEGSISQQFYDTMAATEVGGDEKERVVQIKSEVRQRENHDTPTETKRVIEIMKDVLDRDATLLEIGGGFFQRRSGYLCEEFKNYLPLNICSEDIRRYAAGYKRAAVVADAQSIPLKDNSIDCVFTHNVLEHPMDPGRVLEEIARILKPGGLAVHKDAWFCRWWQRFGLVGITPVSEMTMCQKLIFVSSKVTEFPLIRFPPIIVKRAVLEITRHHFSKPKKLRFRPLKPNYDLMYACDEDAAASIDPMDIVRFYESRGGKTIEKMTFSQRVFFRAESVVMRMP